MANLLISDCSPLFTMGLAHLLRDDGHLIMGQGRSAAELIAQLSDASPDFIILDTRLPANGALSVLKHIEDHHVTTPVMLIAHDLGDAMIERFRALGTACIVGHNRPTQIYLECLHSMMNRSKCCAPNPPKKTPLESCASLLSGREMQLAEMVLHGKRNEEIARLTGITTGTVKVHLARIYRKLNISSRVELIILLQQAEGTA